MNSQLTHPQQPESYTLSPATSLSPSASASLSAQPSSSTNHRLLLPPPPHFSSTSSVDAQPPPSVPVHVHIPDTRFLVDGFRHAHPFFTAYFLSHAHSDHYTGLSTTFHGGPIYCSQFTKDFIIWKLNVDSKLIHVLPLHQEIIIQGVTVICVDANHCPGALQFCFLLSNGKKYVHTGDMRFSQANIANNPFVKKYFVGCDALFLDTTYCHPKYAKIPPQNLSIDYIIEKIRQAHHDPHIDIQNTLFLISTYVIGKEKILAAISKRCGKSIYIEHSKAPILALLEKYHAEATNGPTDNMQAILHDIHGYGTNNDNQHNNDTDEVDPGYNNGHRSDVPRMTRHHSHEMGDRSDNPSDSRHQSHQHQQSHFSVLFNYTTDPNLSNFHVVPWGFLGDVWPYFKPNHYNIREYARKFSKSNVIAFLPTGWNFNTTPGGTNTPQAHAHCMDQPNLGTENNVRVIQKDDFTIHLVPYSEHSSFDELREYVKLLRPAKVIPTVGAGDGNDSTKIHAITKHFKLLLDHTKSKQLFFDRWKNSSKPIPSTQDIITSQAQFGNRDSAHDGFINAKHNTNTTSAITAAAAIYAPTLVSTAEQASQHAINSIHSSLSQLSPDQSLMSHVPSSAECVNINTLIQITQLSTEEATSLLSKARGDIETALNLYLDQAHTHSLNSPTHRKPTRKVSDPQVHKSKKISTAPTSRVIDKVSKPSTSRIIDKAYKTSTTRVTHKGQKSMLSYLPKRKVVDPQDHSDLMQPTTTSIAVPATTSKKQKLNPLPHHDVNRNVDDTPKVHASPTHTSTKIFPDQNSTSQTHCSPTNEPASKKVQPTSLVNSSFLNAGKTRLSVDIKIYEMAVAEYDPVEHACWSRGHDTPYRHLASAFDAIISTKKRLKISDILCNMFRSIIVLSPNDLISSVYLTLNKIGPDHSGLELTIGGSTVAAALAEVTGVKRTKIRELYRELGDLGDVARKLKHKQLLLKGNSWLTVAKVFETFLKIARDSGHGSVSRKKSLCEGLLRQCQGPEIVFIVRSLIQNMRIGANAVSVMAALGKAFAVTKDGPNLSKEKIQQAEVTMKNVYNVCPDISKIIPYLIDGGIENAFKCCHITPGIPVKPKLAKISEGIDDVLKKIGQKDALVEYKYDGQRAQIHFFSGSVKIFSRNGEDKTAAFPDVVELIRQQFENSRQGIIDCEIVAIDKTGKIGSFQELSTRARGTTTSAEIKVNVAIFVFDILFLDDVSLLTMPLRIRRGYLQKLLENTTDPKLKIATSIQLSAPNNQDAKNAEMDLRIESIESVFQDSLKSGCEGIMVKDLDIDYEPSKRCDDWLKLKKDYCEGTADSLDVVPIGAWYGNGRKAGWFSPFLVAIWDSEREEFQSVCRVLSGFTDAFYKEKTEMYKAGRILSSPRAYFNTGEQPNVWFEPCEVWEIKGADFTLSPVHKSGVGLVHPSRGISVRFPRFICVREDKRIEDSTDAKTIAQLFESQSRKYLEYSINKIGEQNSNEGESDGERDGYEMETASKILDV